MSGIEVQFETGLRPAAFGELACAGQGDVGVLHVGPAKGDIGDDQVGKSRVVKISVRRDRCDTAIQNGCDTDIARRRHGQAVKILQARRTELLASSIDASQRTFASRSAVCSLSITKRQQVNQLVMYQIQMRMANIQKLLMESQRSLN